MPIRSLILLFNTAVIVVGCISRQSYPDGKVIEYVNLDSAEIKRQVEFERRGVQEIATVVLPEGELGTRSEKHGLPYHFGWPHAVMIDNTIVLHIKDLFLIRSTDGGRTWEEPLFVEGAPIIAMVATRSGKLVAASVDRNEKTLRQRARTMQVLISDDKGASWKRHTAHVDMPIGLQGLTSRIIEHPKFGLITGAHYNARKDTLTFLVSEDEGLTWRSANFPVGLPLINHGLVVFLDGENNLGAFVRNQKAVGGRYLDAWTSFAQFAPVNADSVERFEDLKWKGAQTNIWIRKDDSSGAQYNPVSGRIEAVTTKREWGFPYRDRGYLTLNLWSIDPRAFQNGSSNWRYEGTLLRSKGEKARVKNPRDGMHPAGTVIDERQGVEHVFFYAGDRAHGGDGAPPTGRTGIFRLSRTLDTKRWVKENRVLDNYEEVYRVNEEFDNLDKWVFSGSPTGIMSLPRTEPAYRAEVALPGGTLKADGSGHLYLKTVEPGYYGLHYEDVIATNSFRLTFRAKVERFPRSGYALGVHVNVGAEKYDVIIKEDGIYQWEKRDPEKYRKIADAMIGHEWHDWQVDAQEGHVKISRDGILLGEGSVRMDGTLGHRPITISAMSAQAEDIAELQMEHFRFENVDVEDGYPVAKK